MSLLKEDAMSKLILNFSSNTFKVAKQKQTKGYFVGRKKLLEEYWLKFTTLHDEVLDMVVTGDKETERKSILDPDRCAKIEAAYCESVGELNDALDELTTPDPSTLPPTVNISPPADTLSSKSSRLPIVELGKFDGSFQGWLQFKDMFTSLVIQDPSLSNVLRLQYLKSCIEGGEAEALLNNLSVSEDSFSTAWELLTHRFDNKRRLIKTYLRDITKVPQATQESAEALRKILDSITEATRALQSLGRPTDHWDDWFVFLVTEKLDQKTLRDWEMSLESPNHIPQYKELKQFLENRMQGLEAVTSPAIAGKPKQSNFGSKPPSQAVRTYHAQPQTSGPMRCIVCAGKHILMFCDNFKKLTSHEKFEFVLQNKLCKNCLRTGHGFNDCTSPHSCLVCQQKHHTMLHDACQTSTPTGVASHHTKTNQNDLTASLSPVMLATAMIGVRSATGHVMKLRALLDSGSQASFISEFAAQQLHLHRIRVQIPVTGVTGSKSGTATGLVEYTITSLQPPEYTIKCSALILPRLTQKLPSMRIDPALIPESSDLALADPKFYEPGAIDVILGADIVGSLLCSDIIRKSPDAPVAQRTHLGWIVYGRCPDSARHPRASFCASTVLELNELVQTLWKFNNVEEINLSPKLTLDELYCEEFFERTVSRSNSGRYIVRYPFKNSVDLSVLAGSRSDALKLFYYQKNRLEADPCLKNLYEKFMTEYLELGHMRPVRKNTEAHPVCYIPHHGVYKEDSSTTKLRTVFNGSRKNKLGSSLNDCLLVGPKLQNDLSAILLKWRLHRIAFMSDIEKCYRQILVDERDVDMQRIIWKDSQGNPCDYQLLTVTYGLNCSPYLTIKVLHTLAKDEGADFPQAAAVLKESFYMDDCLSGAESLSDALELQRQLQQLLRRGGFLLRKWNSNSTEFVQHIKGEHTDNNFCCDLSLDRETKALGIYWSCHEDVIGYKLHVTPVTSPITKKQQLSDVAKIYDPTCLLAPAVITGKILFQQLWVLGLAWDDVLPEPYQTEWIKFRDELHLLETIKVPRWVFTQEDTSDYQIHVFSDASSAAYAAVAYLRVLTANDDIKVSILLAKTKVAPLKKITVPCLELNGALLAATLVAKVKTTCQWETIKTFCWSDSKTVLSWIHSNPGNHKQYVANRLVKIQELTSMESWRYVRTTCNPADVASRGIYPAQLENYELWWNGPSWLVEKEDKWPQHAISPSPAGTDPAIVALTTNINGPSLEDFMLRNYSNLDRLLAVTSWCRRFAAAARKMPHETKPWCTATERTASLLYWIRYVQNAYFANEIFSIRQNRPLNSKSKLLKLHPILDDDGYLRLNGRLAHAILPEYEKHRIILPKHSHLSKLFIAQAHTVTLHGGTQATLNALSRRYWIIDAHSAVKSFIHRCITCIRQRSNPTTQIMGNVPAHRCTPAQVFEHCGLDYGGPYNVRVSKGRGHSSYKGWVALFICLSTRAIHLELVSDMTTDAFLAALRRFFAQRGYSSHIYSDCATTFKSADTMLRDDIDAINRQFETAAHHITCHGVTWHFIPPGSPNFGGVWEAGIKSMKHHLKRVIGESTLTFEEFFTVLKQVEAVLNSRPISAMSDDPTDLTALTPGHFLVGRPLIAVPEPQCLDVNTGRLTKWKQLQQMQQDFWRRWHLEYLHTLQVRHKWQQSKSNIKLNDLVLIRDEKTPPTQWLLGRVLEVHCGVDAKVRVVTIRTKSSVIKRAISKLVVLPIEDIAKTLEEPQSPTTVDPHETQSC